MPVQTLPLVLCGPLRPGERQVAMDLANFFTGEGTSHLLSLGEFYVMYLFPWSDVVWSEIPKFEQAFPAEAKELAELMKQDDVERDSGRYMKLANKHSTFEQERLPLINYRNGLKQVRRLLANVPTYMMFDDHEVTDDWYIHCAWTEGVLGCELGRRIVVRLVSRSLKNEDVKTHYMAWKALPEPEGYLGWSSPGKHLSKKGKAIRVDSTPAVQKVPAGDIEVTPAEWRYRIEFCRDIREGAIATPALSRSNQAQTT